MNPAAIQARLSALNNFLNPAGQRFVRTLIEREETDCDTDKGHSTMDRIRALVAMIPPSPADLVRKAPGSLQVENQLPTPPVALPMADAPTSEPARGLHCQMAQPTVPSSGPIMADDAFFTQPASED